MRMQSAVASAALLVIVTGCASQSSPVTSEALDAVAEADEAQVEGCEFLGTVLGQARKTSLIGGAKSRREAVFVEVSTETAALGGTHFVVEDAEMRNSWHVACGWMCGDKLEVVAKAYRCAVSDPEA